MSTVSQKCMVTVLCPVHDSSTSRSTVEEGMDKFSCGYDKLKLRYKSFTCAIFRKRKKLCSKIAIWGQASINVPYVTDKLLKIFLMH